MEGTGICLRLFSIFFRTINSFNYFSTFQSKSTNLEFHLNKNYIFLQYLKVKAFFLANFVNSKEKIGSKKSSTCDLIHFRWFSRPIANFEGFPGRVNYDFYSFTTFRVKKMP